MAYNRNTGMARRGRTMSALLGEEDQDLLQGTPVPFLPPQPGPGVPFLPPQQGTPVPFLPPQWGELSPGAGESPAPPANWPNPLPGGGGPGVPFQPPQWGIPGRGGPGQNPTTPANWFTMAPGQKTDWVRNNRMGGGKAAQPRNTGGGQMGGMGTGLPRLPKATG